MQHSDHAPAMPTPTAPWWMDGETLPTAPKEPAFLIRGLRGLWQRCIHWLLWPLTQQDPMTCNEHLLLLLAWERGVTRLFDEPLTLFRLRVKYAWENYQDAGSGAGFKQIFERLGLGHVTIKERQPGSEWDVITIELADSVISENQALVAAIIRLYGRTCRRYRYEVTYPITMTIRAGAMHQCHHVYIATL